MEKEADRLAAETRYWDERRREQLGFLNNALLGLAIAGLILIPQLLVNQEVKASTRAVEAALFGVRLTVVAVMAGLFTGLSRLYDFREEAKKARMLEEKNGKVDIGVQKIEKRLGRVGDLTWVLFYAQLGSSILALVSLVASLLWATEDAAQRLLGAQNSA